MPKSPSSESRLDPADRAPSARPTSAADGTSPGVEGNARLTGATGLVVLVLSLIEIATVLLGIRGVLSLHVTVGLLLVPPVALKLASTTWRMIRYYSNSPPYRRLGPPHPLLRVLSPVLGVLTIALLGTGIALILAPVSGRNSLVKVHKIVFYLWLLMLVFHVSAHFSSAVRLAGKDWFTRRRGSVSGGPARRIALLASLAAGALFVLAFAFSAMSYLHP